MDITRNQHTIASECRVEGTGYWSAKDVTVVMRPADANTGIRLIRNDLPGNPECPAHVSFRNDASLRTNLANGAAKFEMVEHLLAALYALEIDNCIVEVDSHELPGLDGSSQPFTDALVDAGLVIQAAERPRLVIDQMITVRDGDAWISASPTTAGQTQFGYELIFDRDQGIPNQSFSTTCTPRRFSLELSPCRTFVTESQAQSLHAKGIATHVGYEDLLVFGENGPINNQLHFPNECARHKTLDLIGDLALTGVELVGKFTSHRGGHQLNGKLSAALYQLALQKPGVKLYDTQGQRRAA